MERSGGVGFNTRSYYESELTFRNIPLLKECDTRCSFQAVAEERRFDMRPRRGAMLRV
jgi:hypothetical protein